MSDADPEAITVTGEGITVHKSLNDQNFQTLAIVFDVHSERDEAAHLVINDEIPEDVPMDDIGFHPQYGAEYWSAHDEVVVFQREIDPGEEYKTIYGIREYDDETASEFLIDPEIEVEGLTEPSTEDVSPTELEDIVSEDRSDVVRDLISGERDSIPGLGDDEPEPETPLATDDDDDAAVTEEDAVAATPGESQSDDREAPEDEVAVESEEFNLETDIEVASGGGGDEEATEAGEVTVPVTGGVTRVLIKELRAGNVSDDDLQFLRQELSPERSQGATEARIRHLQNEVSDLAAYTDAFEAFLDENGLPEDFLDGFRSDIEGIHQELEDIGSSVDPLLDEVEDIQGSFDRLEDTVTRLDEQIESNDEEIESIDEAITEINDSITELDDEIGGVKDTAVQTHEFEQQLTTLTDLEERIKEFETDFEDVRQTLEEIADFHDRLSSVFGGLSAEDDVSGEAPDED